MKSSENLYFNSIQRYKFKSLLSIIFVSYISILFIVMVVDIGMYYYVKNVLVKREASISEDYLNYASIIVDGELLHAKEAMYEFLQNPQIVVDLNSINENINGQIDIIKALVNFKTHYKIVDKCFLYNKNLLFVLGNSGAENKDTFLKDLYISYNIDMNAASEILDNSKEFRIIPNYVDNSGSSKNRLAVSGIGKSKSISLITGVSYSSNINRVIVTVYEKAIHDVIADTKIASYGTTCIVDGDGYIISSSSISKTGTRIDKNLMEDIKKKQNDSTIKFNDNLVVFEKSKFFDGYYITLTPYTNITKNIKTIWSIFTYSLIILIIVIIFDAGLYSKVFYSVIVSQLRKLNINRDGEKDYKDEFTSITSLIDNIQSRNIIYDENVVLTKMIEDGYSKEAKSLLLYNQYQVVVIVADLPSKLIDFISEYIDANKLNNYILKSVTRKEGGSYFIINSDNIEYETVKNYIANLKKEIENNYKIFIVMSMGNVRSDLNDLNISIQTAMIAISLGNCDNGQYIFEYSENMKETFNIYFPSEFEMRITDALLIGSAEKVENIICNIFEQNSELPHLYMKIINTQFINVFIKLANKHNLKYNVNEITANVENEIRVSHVKLFIIDLYKGLSSKFSAHQDTTKRVESFVVEYIQNYYFQDDINIEKIAEKLNLSSSYVSTLFKKSTGIAFSQYLLEYRINKAIDLLKNTDYSVKEISQKVGAGTYNSFIRSFGNIMGISPGEYRIANKKS